MSVLIKMRFGVGLLIPVAVVVTALEAANIYVSQDNQKPTQSMARNKKDFRAQILMNNPSETVFILSCSRSVIYQPCTKSSPL